MSSIDSIDINVLKSLKVDELKKELRFRHLPDKGNKDELVDFLLADNERVIADELQEALIASRVKQNEDMKKLVELQREVELLKNVRMETTDKSQIPMELLNQLVVTQKLISENMNVSNNSQVQIISTNDTANAISLYYGKKHENVEEWIEEVERISSHAKWTSSLTLVNAASRLRGSALNWNKVSGKQINSWEEWKRKISERFISKMSFSDFIKFQGKRILRSDELIVEYIFDKDAIIEKAPFKMQQSDRVSLILEGIIDNTWAVPLATSMCCSVQELINHATPLDTIRKLSTSSSSVNTNSILKGSFQKDSKQIHRFNPTLDKKEDQICFKCKSKGHISYDCKSDKTNINQKSNWTHKNKFTPNKQSVKAENDGSIETNFKNKSINCIQNVDYSLTPKVTQIPVTINGSVTIDALPDNGSCVTLLRKCFIPENTIIHPWQDGAYATPDGDCTPCGWITLRVQVGKIDYIMPKVGLCESLPIAMILGRDWQSAVHATIIIEPNGAICITTPTSTQEFGCVKANNSFVGCVVESRFSSKPLVSKSTEVKPKLIKHEEAIEIKDTFLSENQNKQLQDILNSYEDIFSMPEAEIGEFPNLEMEIKLSDHRPIKCKPYRVSEPDRIFMREQVDKWIENKVCRFSNSAYAAPAFVVEQPFHVSTPKRVVIDYSRTINPVTIKDPFPIDQMDEMIKKLAGKKYKTVVDLKQAFNNIKIKEEDVHKTAAITPDHHIEFTRVIFGLSNAPAVLARAVSEAYGHLQKFGLAKYYDDIGGAHDLFEDHLEFLRKLFEATRKHKLKFTRQKCNFAVRKIKLLGRILDENGDYPDPNRIAAVQRYETLDTIHEVRSFLGFANTLRRYIKNFAVISRPLSNILKKSCSEVIKSKNQPVTLNQEQQQAFVELKLALTSPPLLSHFKQDALTTVETDASYKGLGACLSQLHNGDTRIIEYASRTLKDAEKKYHSNELEVTAVHWAVTDKFRLYLIGKKFKLLTDSYSTAYIVSKAKLNRKFARYVVDLSSFDFDPIYRSGKLNHIADHLSRHPQPDLNENHLCLAIIPTYDEKLELAQKHDAFCQQITKKLESTRDNLHIQQIKHSYKYVKGILVHVNTEYGREVFKTVIPFSCRSIVLKSCHDNAGHFDAKKTLEKLKTRFWWSTMRKDTKLYVRGCIVCQKINRRTTLAYGLLGERPIPQVPFQVISADHLSLPPTKSGNSYILAHICHATRFLVARPTFTTATEDIINTVEKDIINQYGPPLTYIGDNGSSFTSAKFQQFLEKYGIEHLLSPPYTPQSNGLIERSNATIISVISKFTLENPDDWDEKLPNLILAINNTQQSSSKYSPFYLLHGYEPRIIMSELNLGTITSEISRELQIDNLSESREKAAENIKKKHDENKKRFDKHRLNQKFKKGDLVLYNWPLASDTKLSPRYKGPFVIENSVGNVCYKIKRADHSEKKIDTRVVHIQSLKPFLHRPNLDDPGNISFEDSIYADPEPEVDPEPEADPAVINASTRVDAIDDNPTNISSRGRVITKPKWHDDYVTQ